jgi:hypothetical protein
MEISSCERDKSKGRLRVGMVFRAERDNPYPMPAEMRRASLLLKPCREYPAFIVLPHYGIDSADAAA